MAVKAMRSEDLRPFIQNQTVIKNLYKTGQFKTSRVQNFPSSPKLPVERKQSVTMRIKVESPSPINNKREADTWAISSLQQNLQSVRETTILLKNEQPEVSTLYQSGDF